MFITFSYEFKKKTIKLFIVSIIKIFLLVDKIYKVYFIYLALNHRDIVKIFTPVTY